MNRPVVEGPGRRAACTRRPSGVGRLLTGLVVVPAMMSMTACGARWSDDQEAAVVARYAESASGATATGAPEDRAGDESTASTMVPDAAPSADAPGTDGDAVGSADVTGGGDGGAVPGAAGEQPGASACTSPTDAVGTTAEQLTLGTISSLSGPVPGLGSSFEAAARAHVAFRNATGGVCGREVVLKTGDDGGDNARNRALFNEMDGSVLAVTTGPAGGIDGGAEVVAERRIPTIGTAITQKINDVESFFNITPAPDPSNVPGKYRYLKEHGATKAALVYVEQGGNEARVQRQVLEAAGFEIVLDRAFGVQTLSYDSLARAVVNSGADYLYFLHEYGASASMAQSMADTGYPLDFNEYVTAYGTDFIDLAGAAAEGVTGWLYALPAEDGGVVPAHADFLTWMQRTSPNTSLDTFAVQGWVSAKAILDALEDLPGPISRDALLASFHATTDYDADGLLAPINLSEKKTSGCLVGMIIRGGVWTRLAPSEGFLC